MSGAGEAPPEDENRLNRQRGGIRFSADMTTVFEYDKHSPLSEPVVEEPPPADKSSRASKSGILRRTASHSSQSVELTLNTFQNNSDRLLSDIGQGCFLRKRNRHGKLARRWFSLSEDGSELVWSKAKPTKPSSARSGKTKSIFGKLSGKKKMYLANVAGLVYGSPGYPTEIPWLCFTMQFHNDRALHIMCDNEAVVDAWFLGLQALVPLSKYNITRGRQLWYRMRWKLQIKAVRAKVAWDPAFVRTTLMELMAKEPATECGEGDSSPDVSTTTREDSRSLTATDQSRSNSIMREGDALRNNISST